MKKGIYQLLFALLAVISLMGCGDSKENSNQESANEQGSDQGTDTEKPVNQDSTNLETTDPHAFDLPKGDTAEAQEAFNSEMTTQSVDYTMADYLNYVFNDIHNFWAELMIQAGYPEPVVHYVFPTVGESVPSSCEETGYTSELEFYYCPADDQIVFTQQLAVHLWEGTLKVNDDSVVEYNAGDFSVAVLLAHEYAHSLQGELGWFPNGKGLVPTKRTEQSADCLAGVWASSVYSRNLLETGDIEEVMRTLSDLGDDSSSTNQDHGSPDERTEAFSTGYYSGSSRSCDHYLYNDY
ncbi:neutral zinc metallopeptidase [Planococcus shenhongbingii]|uniref:Neutral zinc metallopeptidase n=1 Tax=Planococcus shenhongbingii TaxID=3058398 RepID=A0ABT8N9T2_9BACL|nr:neutral zinc metallopeptidase [Planococcus sp. N017]MDN7244637.1 neutral zinc metallopeptidase [Planococcus sp. N017]